MSSENKRFNILDNPQKDQQVIFLLETRLSPEERWTLNPYGMLPPGRTGCEDSPLPMGGISIMKHYPDSSSWRVSKTLTQFVEETFKEFEIHKGVVEDGDFRFKLRSCGTIIGKSCRRGAGNSIYLGKGVKFGPMVQAMLDDSLGGHFTTYDAPWVPEGKLLMLYQGDNKLDVPFVVSSNLDILVNENVSAYGRFITVPESQRE
jgi:hypothetical protein